MAEGENNLESILNQSEVDALIASTLSDGGGGGASGPATFVPLPKTIQTFKFRTASFLAPGELRRVRIKHEEYAINLASPLSQFTRCPFSIRLSNMEMVSCRTVIETMDGPSHLTLLRLDPMAGLGLIEVSLPLALTVVSRLLGGKGLLVKEERNLSEIEMTLMNGFVDIITNEYAQLWRPYEPSLKPVSLQNETSARFLKIGADTLDAFLLTLEARFNDCVGTIRMAFLHSTLQPLIEKLVEEISTGIGVNPTNKGIGNSKTVDNIPIPVNVLWKGLNMTIRDVCSLKPDDVILLEPDIASRTVVDLSNKDKFLGQIGRKGDHLAVKITSKI